MVSPVRFVGTGLWHLVNACPPIAAFHTPLAWGRIASAWTATTATSAGIVRNLSVHVGLRQAVQKTLKTAWAKERSASANLVSQAGFFGRVQCLTEAAKLQSAA